MGCTHDGTTVAYIKGLLAECTRTGHAALPLYDGKQELIDQIVVALSSHSLVPQTDVHRVGEQFLQQAPHK